MLSLRSFFAPLAPLVLASVFVGCGGPTAPVADTTPAPPATAATPESGTTPALPTPEPPSQEGWTLGVIAADSRLTWTAVKDAGAEVGGTLSVVDGGVAVSATDLSATRGALKVDLRTVDSGNPARDTNLRDLLFEAGTAAGSSAKVEITGLKVEPTVLDVGGVAVGTAEFTALLMQGKAAGSAPIKVTRTDPDHWTVETTAPATLSLEGMGLSAQLARLITACGHQRVDDVVRVAASLRFGPKSEDAGKSSTTPDGRTAPPGPVGAGTGKVP